MQRRYYGIDLTKYLLCFLVVAIHYPPLTTYTLIGSQLLSNGLCRVAVPYFFIASGFLCFNRVSLDNYNIKEPLRYAVHVIKLYLYWSIIYLAITIRAGLRNGKTVAYNFFTWLKNFFFTGSEAQLWYLNALWPAIVIVACLLYCKWSVKQILLLGGALYIIGVLGQTYYGIIEWINNPIVLRLSELYFDIFSTTRNAVFEGVFFVAMGVFFSKCANNNLIDCKMISLHTVMWAGLLLIEVYVVWRLQIARGYDLYFLLIPVAYNLFAWSIQVELPQKYDLLYKEMRDTSAWMFYLHIFVGTFVLDLLNACIGQIDNSLLSFIVVVFASYVIIVLIKLVKLLFRKRKKARNGENN